MNAFDVRRSFLEFFEERGHKIVKSSSLLPEAPNLLFTNAGMNPFVPYFLGERRSIAKRVADTQKCLRAGGKHNDLEDVGFDTYHHTFFEMLGNWSFGDYFKKDAIEWAWELLTKVWKFPKERLYATVYKPEKGDPAEFDQEAFEIWKNIFEAEGMDPAVHICYSGKKDNFWMMGETGPCGPCTEIHMDLTPNGDTQGKLVNMDSHHCVEIWNLVFIQFNAQADGAFKQLSSKFVDTGMGLERVAGIISCTKNFSDFSAPFSNYNSDLFEKIFEKITELSGKTYNNTVPSDKNSLSDQEKNDCAFRILADHARTLSFSIADGILPGNEGRNYVLRRILRRAVMFGQRLGMPECSFAELGKVVIELMGGVFPELAVNAKTIEKVLLLEEKTFLNTLSRGMQVLNQKIENCTGTLNGGDAFLLYDTYGFPLDLTKLIAAEKGIKVDEVGFNKAMEEQRERARKSRKSVAINLSDDDSSEKTEFVGYDYALLENFESKTVDVIVQNGDTFAVFEKTPFYAEKGGQIGDAGYLLKADKKIAILDTLESGGKILHKLKAGDLKKGDSVKLFVDKDRRKSIQRHHTATHLLNWALRKVLGNHVKQAGSLVTEDYLRFDFSHFEKVSAEDLSKVEELCNGIILENKPVVTKVVSFEEKPEDCIAFFEDKYGDSVRVVSLGEFGSELCGGTHVAYTGELGLFKIRQESSIASGVRRIEAVVGDKALNFVNRYLSICSELTKTLSCKENDLLDRINKLLKKQSELEKKLKQRSQKLDVDWKSDVVEREGMRWLAWKTEDLDKKEFQAFAKSLYGQAKLDLLILFGRFEQNGQLIVVSSAKAVEKGFKASSIIRKIAEKLDGRGGGKDDFAMGGFKDFASLDSLVKELKSSVDSLRS